MFGLELLHPGWLKRRKYRTLAGLYSSLVNAIRATPTDVNDWKVRKLVIGHYQYSFWECHLSHSDAWWRITEEPAEPSSDLKPGFLGDSTDK